MFRAPYQPQYHSHHLNIFFVGNQNPIVLGLSEGSITIGSEDIPYLEEFTESLTKGQVKSKFQKMMARKVLSHDDTVVVAETLASQYTDFVKKSNKVRK
jgi:hypothetical protein